MKYIIKINEGLYEDGLVTGLTDSSKFLKKRVSSGIVVFGTSNSKLAEIGDTVFFKENNQFFNENHVVVHEKDLKLILKNRK